MDVDVDVDVEVNDGQVNSMAGYLYLVLRT